MLPILPWAWITQPLLPARDNMTAPTVAPVRLETHVRTLCERFFPRDPRYPDNLDRAAAYIRREFQQAGGRVSEQPYEVDGKTYRNVIAMFGPETQDRIVVGAHYDAVPAVPGADDNASGVAGLLELAYLMGTTRLPLRVELVAYTLEEDPYFLTEQMGSAVHVASLRKQGARVRIMFSLEMIGYFTDAPGSQRFPLPLLSLFYPSEGNFIAVVGKLDQGLTVRRVKQAMHSASPLPVHSINAPSWIPGVDWSDHRNYWKAGYDAVMITDTAFYRNDNYHTLRDRPETLDYRRMAMVVQDVYEAVLAFTR
jgi:Zn-dependent M28 family amino/carboxypeptidase